MSRNTDKIKKALEAKGYKVVEVEWSPITSAPIMCGPEGGWWIEFDLPDRECEYEEYPYAHNYTIQGYNVREVLDEIAELPILREKVKD